MPTKMNEGNKTFCINVIDKPGNNDEEPVNFNTNYTNPLTFLPFTGMRYDHYCMKLAIVQELADDAKVYALSAVLSLGALTYLNML